jgi:hypothetical protein
VDVSAAVREGTPFEELCQAVQVLDADMIVLTTHGYTGVNHFWLGSTAERVVRHATCPVMVVRSPVTGTGVSVETAKGRPLGKRRSRTSAGNARGRQG